MNTLLLLTALLSPASGHAKASLDGGVAASCELTLHSALRDLRGFCEQEPYNQRRLVEFGFQLGILRDCDLGDSAKQIQLALDAKINRKDGRGCTELAEREAATLKEGKLAK